MNIESDIVQDVQKQEIDSPIVTLWELQLKDNEYAHFFSGVEEDLSSIHDPADKFTYVSKS